MTGGRPSCSNVRNSFGIRRSTMPMWPRCLKTATRNRALSPKANPKSVPPVSCNSCWFRSGVMLFISDDGVVGLERLRFQPDHVAAVPHHRGLADGDVQVADALLDDGFQQLVDLNDAIALSMQIIQAIRIRIDSIVATHPFRRSGLTCSDTIGPQVHGIPVPRRFDDESTSAIDPTSRMSTSSN